MDTRIFLQGFDSKKSSNTSSGLDVQFKGRRKLLPLNDIAEVISQYDQYREEREKCNIIRLTCQVNPICSNVLFNEVTEVVKYEGSSKVAFINYGNNGKSGDLFNNVVSKSKEMTFWDSGAMAYLDEAEAEHNINKIENSKHPTNAIRDMQLSNDEFIYHCGIDIFNNHLIRSNTFKTVCKCIGTEPFESFNTIADMMRDVKGGYVAEKICYPVTSGLDPKDAKLHIYEIDDILSYSECVKNRLVKKYNGWLGFENKSKIKSYLDFAENNEMQIERPLMYLNGGDFVDMYPSRDLYTFYPKYNTYRHRIEKNWNYCVTYPSSSYTPSDSNSPFSDIIEYRNGLNSLKAAYFDENIRSDNGTTQIVIYSIAKHGLSKGDYVNIYKTYTSNDEVLTEKVIDNAEVLEVVDDYIFMIFSSDVRISKNWVYLTKAEKMGTDDLVADGRTFKFIEDTFSKRYFNEVNDPTNTRYYIVNDDYVNIDKDAQNISYKKVVGDIECDYYIRIFSKLPNFKFASGDTSSEYEIYKEREDGNTRLSIYQDHMYEFENHVSKLAFAENIYTDGIGEIVFTDDIDISNIHDNLGRPLTELYLTIIKNNQGYKEWYGYHYTNDDWNEEEISNDTVEYSHAFGMVTCGIETSQESSFGSHINCINRINNIGSLNGDNTPFGYLIGGYINPSGRSYSTESGKKLSILEQEVSYLQDKNFYGDLCYYDNYNAIERHISYVMQRFNSAQRESLRSKSDEYFSSFVYDEISKDDYDGTHNYEVTAFTSDHIANNKREGYYYIPHYRIPIKTFDKIETMMPDFLSIREFKQLNGSTYQFTTLQQHFLSVGDKAMLYDTINDKYYTLIATSGSNDNYRVFTCNVYNEEGNETTTLPINSISTLKPSDDMTVDDFKLFKMDNLEAPSYARVLKDGTCRVIWRDILNNGFNESDDSVEEYPFTNGAFYVNKRIDLYVRRQDPYDFYGLYNEADIEGDKMEIKNEDNYIKDTEIEC